MAHHASLRKGWPLASHCQLRAQALFTGLCCCYGTRAIKIACGDFKKNGRFVTNSLMAEFAYFRGKPHWDIKRPISRLFTNPPPILSAKSSHFDDVLIYELVVHNTIDL